jgi:uncharacterized protein
MDVVIAGGTGFLGRPLAAALARAGHQVTVLSRNPPRGASDIIAWTPDHASRDQAWVQRIGRANAVVNLAGTNIGGSGRLPARWTPQFKASLWTSRLTATNAIVEAIGAAPTEHRPRILVNASAIGYYGNRGDELLNESSRPGTDFFGRLCTDWEDAARAAEPLGVRVVRVRTGVVLERHAMAADLLILASRLFVGGPLGSGQQWWSWIHRDDVLGLMMHALLSDSIVGPMNAVAPNPRRMIDFPRVLGRLLHRPSSMPAPAFALRLVFGEMADALLLASQRVAPLCASSAGYTFHYSSLEDAFEAILHRPT